MWELFSSPSGLSSLLLDKQADASLGLSEGVVQRLEARTVLEDRVAVAVDPGRYSVYLSIGVQDDVNPVRSTAMTPFPAVTPNIFVLSHA
jgi:hypothetical protein